jgi:hypothetical protein
MKSDFLHRFIHSLDVGEVRECEHHLATAKGSLAQPRKLLFDTLLRQQTYDRGKLLRTLRPHWTDKRVSQELDKLYEVLIELVSGLHRRREGRQCPWTLLSDARTLFRKGLVDEAAQVAQKGIARATLLDDVQTMVPLRDLLREIGKNTASITDHAQLVQDHQALTEAAEKLSTYTALTVMSDQLFYWHKRYRTVDAERYAELMAQLPHTELLRGTTHRSSWPSTLRYHTIRAFQACLTSDHRAAMEHYRTIVQVWESNPHRMAQQPRLYREALANLIGMLIMHNGHREALGLLERMEQVPVIHQHDRALHFCHVEMQYLLFYMNTGELEAALVRKHRIMQGLREFGREMPPSYPISFRYNLGVAYVLNDEPGKAKRLFNQVRDMINCPVREDLQGLARLWRLLLLMGDPDFDHYLRNSRPFFRSHQPHYCLERTVHAWIECHWRLKEADALRTSYERLHTAMVTFAQEGIVGADELRMWAQGQADELPLREVYRARFAMAA